MFDNSTNINKKETTTYDVGNQVFGVKLVNGTQLSLDNWISKENKDINKQKKTLHISAFTQKDRTLSQK
jgi:hypothetical protein